MEKKCKNKKCQRILPEGYKYKYCENCRNKQVQNVKNIGTSVIGATVVVGSLVISIITKGKFDPKGKA